MERNRILVVDDDPLIRGSLYEMLRGHGYAVEMAADGAEALDCLKRQPFQLVLADWKMPKVDGIEVLRRIKADPSLRKLPVIMLTTTDDSRDVVRCHELGCNVYMQKPVDYDRFSEAIRRLGKFVPLLHVPQLSPG